MTGSTPGGATAARPWWRRLPLIGAALLVVVAVAAVLALGGDREGRQQGGDQAPAAQKTEPQSTAPAPPLVPPADPSAAPVSADEPPAALPAAPLEDPVAVEQVTAQLASVEEIDAEARARGGVSGPALRVTVRLQNGAGAALALDDVSVTVAFGADATPASPVDDASARPFAGALEPGGAADGVYVFRVPEGERGAVSVQVGVRPGAPVAIFAGPVA